jgi:hypothetical protein
MDKAWAGVDCSFSPRSPSRPHNRPGHNHYSPPKRERGTFVLVFPALERALDLKTAKVPLSSSLTTQSPAQLRREQATSVSLLT